MSCYKVICSQCGKSFYSKRHINGGCRPPEYCSNACRQKAYRLRKKRYDCSRSLAENP